jgi:hypothetical protein
MARAKRLNQNIIILAGSGAEVSLDGASGDLVYVFETDAEFEIKIGDGEWQAARKGSRFLVDEFSSIDVRSDTAQTVNLKWGYGDYTELSAQIIIDDDQVVPVHQQQNAGGSTENDVTVTTTSTTLLTADTNRRLAYIKNNNANLVNVRVGVGGSVPTATKGVEVAPGDFMITTNTGQINAIAVSGTATISISTEELT